MSLKLKSIEQLRNHALEALEDLRSGKIDCIQAGVTGKLCENVISTVKAQLEFARMLNKEPSIDFMGDLSKNKTLMSPKDVKYIEGEISAYNPIKKKKGDK